MLQLNDCVEVPQSNWRSYSVKKGEVASLIITILKPASTVFKLPFVSFNLKKTHTIIHLKLKLRGVACTLAALASK